MKIIVLSVWIACLFGCATTKILKSQHATIPITVRNVSALVDFAVQEDVSDQIKDIVTIMSAENQGGNPLFLDITVRQRSFLQDVTSKNSIYTTCYLSDATGKILHRFCFIDTGTETILNAQKQGSIAKQIVNILEKLEIPESDMLSLPELTLSNVKNPQ